jgi:integrase
VQLVPRARRSQNIGLPARWRFTHGAYYYCVPRGEEEAWDGKQTFRLGKTIPEAYREWADRIQNEDAKSKVQFVGELLDRYALEVIPAKEIATQRRDIRSIATLKKTFNRSPIKGFRPTYVYNYVQLRSKKIDKGNGKVIGGLSAAKHEVAVLSHAFTKAVEWGFLTRHPFKGEVRLEGSAPRTRYVEDWEIIECLTLKNRRKKGSVAAIQAYIRIKLLTGLNQSDLLRLEPARHIKEDGIHVQRRKITKRVGKRTIYEWSPELRSAVKAAMDTRPVHIAPFLFCTKEGRGYIDESISESTGWNSMWQRFMDRVLVETKVTERFTETDLRAKCASDATSLEHARALLSHVDSRTTNKFYRRKPERVTPVK